ncbi:hypothetical protein D3C76_348650 [compost metagenome]
MACSCPPWTTQVGFSTVGDAYCEYQACNSGDTWYAKIMKVDGLITCLDHATHVVTSTGCTVKAGCCG